MDESAPISWLLSQIHDLISLTAGKYAAALTGIIMPLVASAFGLYMLLLTLNYWRGGESNPIGEYLVRFSGWSVIIGFGLNADTYNSVILPLVMGIGPEIANAIAGGGDDANSLDRLAVTYLQIISDGFQVAQEIGGLEGIAATVLVAFKALIVIFGLVPFLVIAAVALCTADVGATLIAMVGPMFFAFLLFPATRQWFSSWLNAALSHALVPIFVAAICAISISISAKIFPAGGGSLVEASFKKVFYAAFANLVLVCLVAKVSQIASSLSGGGVNISSAVGLGQAARSARESMRGSAREIQKGSKAAGAAYQMGKDLVSKIRGNTIRKAG